MNSKAEAQQAVPVLSPEIEFIQNEIKSMQGDKPDEYTIREQLIAGLAQTDGWQELKKELQKRGENYRRLAGIDLSATDLHMIGLKFVVSDAIAGEIDYIVKRVELAYENLQHGREKESTTK